MVSLCMGKPECVTSMHIDPPHSPTFNPRLLSTEELDERFRTQQATIREYRAKRQEILRRREGERKERNETKKRQLEWAQELQVRNFTVASSHHIFHTVYLTKIGISGAPQLLKHVGYTVLWWYQLEGG